jgi:hypothetical protein
MTLAIAHSEGERIVLDCVREARAPFSPDNVVQEFATVLKAYKIAVVTGDRYGGEWPAERFRAHGIAYQPAEQTKSDLYRDLLPILNGHRVELLDHPRLLTQLGSLERRMSRAGRDSIDHPAGMHDDLGNSVAGAVTRAAGLAAGPCQILASGLAERPYVCIDFRELDYI